MATWYDILSNRIAREKAEAEAEAKRRTFNPGAVLGGVLGTALSPLTGGLSLAPLLLSAGGEATRAATGSDLPLADVAMAAGKYLPTGPQGATQTATQASGSLQPTMGLKAQPSFWDSLQGGIGNVGEGLRQTMWMPETYEASQKKKAFADLQSKYGDQMRMSSVIEPVTEASYTVDKQEKYDELGWAKLQAQRERNSILSGDKNKEFSWGKAPNTITKEFQDEIATYATYHEFYKDLNKNRKVLADRGVNVDFLNREALRYFKEQKKAQTTIPYVIGTYPELE